MGDPVEAVGDWAELAARADAHALPPSDYGSTRAIKSVAALLRLAYARGRQDALAAADRAAWQPMMLAPRDGTLVDIWCRRTASRPRGPAGRVPFCRWNVREEQWGYRYTAGSPDEFWVLDGELVAWRPLPPAPGDEP